MNSFLKWWQGYVTVRFRGPGVERLLNNMADSGMILHRAERLTADVVIVRLRVSDFLRLRPLLRGSKINVSILDKHGVPFFLRRFRLRALLAIGLVLSFLFVVYLSNFIWFIDVVAPETLPLESLQQVIEGMGLQSGVARSTVEPRTIEVELLKAFPVLVWAQVTVKGVKVEISLTERDGVEREQAKPGHLYAELDGVVTEILVLQGTAQVAEGNTVRKGDLLISGEYYDARGRKQFGAAQGVVKARVWYEGVGEGALSRWVPIPTGTPRRQYTVTIGSITIPIGRSYARETHLPSVQEWRLSLGRAMVPLRFARIDYQAVEYVKVFISREEAEQVAYGLAWESLVGQGVQKDQVREERQKLDMLADGDGLRVTLQVEVLEDIGRFLSP